MSDRDPRDLADEADCLAEVIRDYLLLAPDVEITVTINEIPAAIWDRLSAGHVSPSVKQQRYGRHELIYRRVDR